MRKANGWMWIMGAQALITGCMVTEDPKLGKSESEALAAVPATVGIEGVLSYGAVVFAENPTTKLERADFHGYEFDGKAGGVITIKMDGSTCQNPDTQLFLFGPENAAGSRGQSIADNDDAFQGNCQFNAQIRNFRLPKDGTYLVVATSFQQVGGTNNGSYRLELTCNNGACVLPGSLSFAETRTKVDQVNVLDRGLLAPADIFDVGDFLFEYIYRTDQGMGNAVVGAPGNGQARPNFRKFPNNVHFAAFGGPEAQSCISCHNVGGDDGAGDNNHNIFQIGDGVNRNTGVPRNPPPLLGSGLRQAAGQDITAELQALLAAGKTQAAATNTNVTVTLRPPTNPINFGTVIARPDGTVDFTGLVGVDTDLIVRPFGWKGREATIRRFIEGGFRVHFGMQTEPSVNNHCRTPNINTFGNGANCQDPDNDGVQKEITDGQLSAEALYMAMLEMPIRIPGATAAAQQRINEGEVQFNNVGCQGCHRQNIIIKSPFLTEKGDTTTGPGVRINLLTDMKEPRPVANANGSITIEIWSDFKRREMGTALADSKNFNQIAASQFITPPLWGVRDIGPWLHDGRAATLQDSVLLHDAGDDVNSVTRFRALAADEQKKIIEFMESLGRAEDLP